MDKEQTCSICGTTLKRPYPIHANYVIADEFTEEVETDVHYAVVHNDLTKRRLDFLDEMFPERERQSLSAEIAAPRSRERVRVSVGKTVEETADGFVKTEEMKLVGFGVPEDLFDHVEVENPNVGHGSDDVARVYTKRELRDTDKTGLVCRDCTDTENHEIIWGADGDD